MENAKSKTGKAIAAASALSALSLAGYSYWARNKKVPTREEVEDYVRSLQDIIGMPEIEPALREEVIKVNGLDMRLYCFDTKPDDPVVIFVPGTSLYGILYGEFCYKLHQKGFNVIAFDPHGHGLSEGKRGVYTMGSLVEQAMAVVSYAIERYNDRVGMTGSSQGGMVSFYAAAADPRLKTAVCHNVITDDEPDNYRMTRWPSLYRVGMSLIPLTVFMPKALLDAVMVPIIAYLDVKAEPSRLFPDLMAWWKQDPLMARHVSLSALISLASTPLAVKVEDITTPIMVIHAEKDNIFPEDYVRRVYDRLNCEKEFLFMPGRPHLVMTDYVDELLPAVSDWFARHLGK